MLCGGGVSCVLRCPGEENQCVVASDVSKQNCVEEHQSYKQQRCHRAEHFTFTPTILSERMRVKFNRICLLSLHHIYDLHIRTRGGRPVQPHHQLSDDSRSFSGAWFHFTEAFLFFLINSHPPLIYHVTSQLETDTDSRY